MNKQPVQSILADGIYKVALSDLGQQEIRVTLLKGLRHCPDDEVLDQWARIVKVEPPSEKMRLWEYHINARIRGFLLKSISETGARHTLITGVSALAAFPRVSLGQVCRDSISLPSSPYSLVISDGDMSALEQFASSRQRTPHEKSIIVCPTSPVFASQCGVFDKLPDAENAVGVYVIGYGSRAKTLMADFFRCVNTPGKARGFVHTVISVDSPTITNEEFDRFHSPTDAIDKLQQFWNMADEQWGQTELPTITVSLLGIEAA